MQHHEDGYQTSDVVLVDQGGQVARGMVATTAGNSPEQQQYQQQGYQYDGLVQQAQGMRIGE